MTAPVPILLDAKATAAALSISVRHLDELVRLGIVPAPILLGGEQTGAPSKRPARRWAVSTLTAWAEAQHASKGKGAAA